MMTNSCVSSSALDRHVSRTRHRQSDLRIQLEETDGIADAYQERRCVALPIITSAGMQECDKQLI